jgi:hypothetical protein
MPGEGRRVLPSRVASAGPYEPPAAPRSRPQHARQAQTWGQVPKHYDDDQITALVCLVALINAASRLAVIVHQQGGSYEPGMFAATFN